MTSVHSPLHLNENALCKKYMPSLAFDCVSVSPVFFLLLFTSLVDQVNKRFLPFVFLRRSERTFFKFHSPFKLVDSHTQKKVKFLHSNKNQFRHQLKKNNLETIGQYCQQQSFEIQRAKCNYQILFVSSAYRLSF